MRSGGAIYSEEATLQIANCQINDNNADGAAIYSMYTDLNIINSIFKNNVGRYYGGGTIVVAYGNLTIINSIFNNNRIIGGSGNHVGGAIVCGYTNLTVINSTFENNRASDTGGAIAAYWSTISIINSAFINNSVSRYGGSAIYSQENNLSIINSAFFNNKNDETGQNWMDIGAICSIGDNISIKNSNFTNNSLAIFMLGNYSNENIIEGCNVYNNLKGILIENNANNTVINYNRIFNNTEYDLNNTGYNTNVNFNWWGSNNPDMSKIIGVIPDNYFIMIVTNLTSLNSNGTVKFQYTFRLNTGEDADNSLLPYFVTEVYTNVTDGIIASFDARYNNTFNITLNTSGDVLYSFMDDNELQNLTGTTTIPEPTPEPPTPTPTPTPTPIPSPSPTAEENNQSTNNPTTASAATTMKETGIPINLILLVLCSVLAVLIGRKQN